MTTVVIQREALDDRIPRWVTDHAAFRRWAKSDGFPERGRYAYLAGELWVDTGMEKLSHNLIKSAVASVLDGIAQDERRGIYFSDGMMLTHVKARLSTEPDGMFVDYATLKAGRAELEDGEESLEVVGAPDVVLEVVSGSSVNKDTVVLRKLYARAGIPEYWLADSRPNHVSFEILNRRGSTYTSVTPGRGGWVESKVFERSFRLMRETDQLGLPVFRLESK